MKTVKSPSLITLAITAALHIAAFLRGGLFPGAIAAALIALLWATSLNRQWHTGNTAAISASTVLSIVGMWLGLPPLLLILSQAFSIATWDLVNLSLSLDPLQEVQHPGAHWRTHLAHLTALILAGTAASAFTLNLNLQLGFLPALVLSFILVISVKQLIQRGQIS